jgi:hypothetical protein
MQHLSVLFEVFEVFVLLKDLKFPTIPARYALGARDVLAVAALNCEHRANGEQGAWSLGE